MFKPEMLEADQVFKPSLVLICEKKKPSFCRKKAFLKNRQIIRLSQADHTFKPGRSYV